MIKKSVKIYLIGFISGIISSTVLILTFPWIYLAFLELLMKKVEIQSGVVKSFPSLSIIWNNLLATAICSFGGYLYSKIYLQLNSKRSSRFLKKLAFFDERARNIPEAHLRYYLVLYIFPVFVLFINGLVLGIFLVFYIENLDIYFKRLYPHAIFEIPAILLSGSIGLGIAEESSSLLINLQEFKHRINGIARKGIKDFTLVVIFLVIAGLLEINII